MQDVGASPEELPGWRLSLWGRAHLTTSGLMLTLQPSGQVEGTRNLGGKLTSHGGGGLVLWPAHC